jgi:hypothetical protein
MNGETFKTILCVSSLLLCMAICLTILFVPSQDPKYLTWKEYYNICEMDYNGKPAQNISPDGKFRQWLCFTKYNIITIPLEKQK